MNSPNPFASPAAGPEPISLRDYFAAAALIGWLATDSDPGTAAEVAAHAYEHADAMLAQREKEPT